MLTRPLVLLARPVRLHGSLPKSAIRAVRSNKYLITYHLPDATTAYAAITQAAIPSPELQSSVVVMLSICLDYLDEWEGLQMWRSHLPLLRLGTSISGPLHCHGQSSRSIGGCEPRSDSRSPDILA